MSERGKTGLGTTMKLVVKQFLEPKHYRQLHRILSQKWSGCHSLYAAVKLMEAHGVKISQEDEHRLKDMSEDRMIEALVARMPQQSRESFEHFFLQLSFVASTTSRLRTAIENGEPELVEEALESAENVGVMSFLIKGAVCQAGSEVSDKEKAHQNWIQQTDDKLSPLLQSQAMHLVTQRALTAAEKTLHSIYGTAKDKCKSFLMGMADGKSKAYLAAIYSTWADHVKRMRHENEVRSEYEAQINDAIAKLVHAKQGKMDIIRRVLNRNCKELEMALMAAVFGAFKDEADSCKKHNSCERGLKGIQGGMSAFKKKAVGHAHNFLRSLGVELDRHLQAFAFDVFLMNIEEVKKDKEEEQHMKAAEDKLRILVHAASDGTKHMLKSFTEMTTGDLIGLAWKGWSEVLGEAKCLQAVEDRHNVKMKAVRDFTVRNKVSAHVLSTRHASVVDLELILVVFTNWKREARIEKVRRWGKDKNDRRKQDLVGVKGLFKNFAQELETSLKDGTPRVAVSATGDGTKNATVKKPVSSAPSPLPRK